MSEIYLRFFIWLIIYFIEFFMFGYFLTVLFDQTEYQYSFLFAFVLLTSITIIISMNDLILFFQEYTVNQRKPILNIDNSVEEPTEKTELIEKPESNIEFHYA